MSAIHLNRYRHLLNRRLANGEFANATFYSFLVFPVLVYEIVVATKGRPVVISGNCMLVELDPKWGFYDSEIGTMAVDKTHCKGIMLDVEAIVD